MKSNLVIVLLSLIVIAMATDVPSGEYYDGGAPAGGPPGPWTKALNPYIVLGNVFIPDAKILTIEPGVVIKFAGSQTIMVQGRLMARGTEADSIIFTSNAALPAPGDWGLINFYYADEPGSSLEYCIIEYGGYSELTLTSIAIQFTSAPVNIAHSTITQSGQTGIWVTHTSRANIIQCVISDNADYGIVWDYSSIGKIRHSKIMNNGNYGIYNGLINGSPYLDLGRADEFGCNTFIGNDATHPLPNWQVYIDHFLNTTSAAGNWWGTTDEDFIDANYIHR